MNENLKPISELPAFLKYCYTVGMLPTSYRISMTYEEQVLEAIRYIKEEIIPIVNSNALATKELQEKFVELVNYVETYLDNLDVQDEVNAKLDQMAESGQLAEIIAQYLELQGLLCYNTIADLKNANNISDGSFVKTYGTNQIGDGIMYFYKIRQITNTDNVDNLQIISLTNYPTLVAERISNFITNDKTNPIFYGADPTGQIDSSNAINNCIQANKGGTINFSQGTYLINQTINLPYNQLEKVSINGNGAKLINNVTLGRLLYYGYDKGLSSANDVGFPSYIKDLFVDGTNSETTYCIDIISGFKDLKILNCTFSRFLNGVRIGETTGNPADVSMDNCLLYGKGSEFDGTGIILNSSDNNINMCRIYGYRKGFIVNSLSLIKECHVLLRWKDQTSTNFDPYPRNGTEFNEYYPLTMFAQVNSNLRCFDSYGDSVYKMLEITTDASINVIGCHYYNSRSNVNNRLFDISINNPKFILNNFTVSIGKNTEGEIIHLQQLLNNFSQININNILITNIENLTNPNDIIMSAQKPYIANKTLNSNVWYLVGIIANNSPYNIIHGNLFINGYNYPVRFSCDANGNVNSIIQFSKGTGNSKFNLGTVNVNGNIYVCISPTINYNSAKFNYKSNYASNIIFDVVPVKNNSVNSSSRLLSDYTELVPTNSINLANVS